MKEISQSKSSTYKTTVISFHQIAPTLEVEKIEKLIDASSPPPSSTIGAGRTKRLKSGHGGNSSTNKYVCGVCDAGVKTVTSFFLHWLESHQVKN
jgi:hypothetical protein